jgi:hypothetical protein
MGVFPTLWIRSVDLWRKQRTGLHSGTRQQDRNECRRFHIESKCGTFNAKGVDYGMIPNNLRQNEKESNEGDASIEKCAILREFKFRLLVIIHSRFRSELLYGRTL